METGGRELSAARGAGVARWLGRWGVAGSLVWGFAEATLFFVVPDVIVGAVAIFSPRKAAWAGLAAVGGAILGGAILFAWAQSAEASATSAVDAVPAIHSWMFSEAGTALREHGGITVTAAAFTGIPYKVVALEMTTQGWSLPSLMAWTIPGRGLRFGLVAGVAGLFGFLAAGWIRRRRRLVLGVWLAIWVAIYAEYWARVGF